ncbi:HipA N-terminal domain-containing protein [Sulfurospirillum cavolei]|uniref:HipA N-terminal domain-containing protein n=1 Tax=Sulfurospirillum cavolei TaxID=366522 RepID=UPI0005A7DCFC|nr:HipA N-terminal domain-containing protein [Sulfurospirillum cavolei]
MQEGNVLRNKKQVGVIRRNDEGVYSFQYDEHYLLDKESKPISVNLPLQKEVFQSAYLFPFFYQLLAEGSLKELQCKEHKIDVDDDFSRLLKTAKDDTIGSITIEEIK